MINEITAITDRITQFYNEFIENHEANVTKGKKSAGSKARKAIGNLKKEVTEYRKLSVEFNKSEK